VVFKKITDPSLAQEMSDLNHAAFGYKSIKNLSRYEIQRRMKDPRYEVYGVLINNNLQGFMFIDVDPEQFLVDSPEDFYIQDFSVWPWAQGKGVGSALLGYVLNVVFPRCSFYLTVDRNNKAVYLYEKFGFKEVPSECRGTYIAMRLERRKLYENNTSEVQVPWR